MSTSNLDFLLSHAPSDTTEAMARAVLQQTHGDVASAVAILWGASRTPTRPIRTEEQAIWDGVREIADACDAERKQALDRMRAGRG